MLRFKTGSFACLIMTTPLCATALDEIYSPNVEYREISLEYNGSHTFDSDAAKNNAASQEFALEAGITPRIMLETSGSLEKDPQGTTEYSATEIEGRFQFFESGENWLDSGMLVAYDYAPHKQDPDSLEVKLLLQKDMGRFTSTANIGFEQDLGPNASGGPDFVFLWNTRYRYSYYLQPGIEIQSDLGQDGTLRHFNNQEHYVGPSLYGHIFPGLNFQAAWLVGVSESSASSAGRILLEYEMHF